MNLRHLFQHPGTRFLAALLAIYAGWFVLYELVVLPDGRVDAALSHLVAASAGWSLYAVGFDVLWEGRVVALAGMPGIIVVNGCNGLSALGLFAGFVFAFPGQWRRRLWFIPAGLALIVLANVWRIAALAVIQWSHPAAFDLAHGFAVSTFFYVVIFALCVVWARVGGGDNTGRSGGDELAPEAGVAWSG